MTFIFNIVIAKFTLTHCEFNFLSSGQDCKCGQANNQLHGVGSCECKQ